MVDTQLWGYLKHFFYIYKKKKKHLLKKIGASLKGKKK
jgi:hypothetical protein